MTEFEIAAQLGLIPHEWHWDDPENSDIWCRWCGRLDPMTPKTTCAGRVVPSRARVLAVIERRRDLAQEEVKALDLLEKALEDPLAPDHSLATTIKLAVRDALVATQGSKKHAALRLRIGERTIYRHVDRHGLHGYCTGERKK